MLKDAKALSPLASQGLKLRRGPWFFGRDQHVCSRDLPWIDAPLANDPPLLGASPLRGVRIPHSFFSFRNAITNPDQIVKTRFFDM